MPTDPPNSPPPLQYELPSGVTRGAFRLLLLLTFINTLLLGTPRQGHALPSTSHPHWDLLPATQPATKP